MHPFTCFVLKTGNSFNPVFKSALRDISTVHEHWRRQLWGTGARAPTIYNNLLFTVHFDLYKVWQQVYVDSCLL